MLGTDTIFLIIVLGPKREVVSIYNENFSTPKDRDPYFIEVHRCVEVNGAEEEHNCGSENNSIVPRTLENITIVVPNLSRDETKFYKYVIYNHTSCKCDSPTVDRKLREKEETGGCIIVWVLVA